MTECLPAGHVVYCDNFFTGVSLALSLERRGIGSCGTVRANRRGLPVQLKKFTTARKATKQQCALWVRNRIKGTADQDQ